jgi:hypothetical protein
LSDFARRKRRCAFLRGGGQWPRSSVAEQQRPHLGRGGNMIRTIAIGLVLSLYAAAAPAAGPSCKEHAGEKKLAGAALHSFMTKCEKDAQTACDTTAQEKKLYGAAKAAFTKKCVKDATGA